MWKFLTICICLMVRGHFAKICPANEVFDECGDGCPINCANFHMTEFFCKQECFPQCMCKGGLIRKSTGECVESKDCTKADVDSPKVVCPKNEVFDFCGSGCPLTCENVNHPPKVCMEFCTTSCFCAENLIRDTITGECVAKENCTQTCGLNEMYLPCNGPKRCEMKCNGDKKCRYKDDCANNCICKDNFFRDRITMNCVPKSQCPMFKAKY